MVDSSPAQPLHSLNHDISRHAASQNRRASIQGGVMSKYVIRIQRDGKRQRHYFAKKRDAVEFAKEVGADKSQVKSLQ